MTRAKKLLWMSAAYNAPYFWYFVNNDNNSPTLQNMPPYPDPVILMLEKIMAEY